MKKLLLLLLACVLLVFPEQTAVLSNGVRVKLREDGTWNLDELPLEVDSVFSPYVTTEDSQLVMLRERGWEYITEEDTIGHSDKTIRMAVVPHGLVEKKPMPTYIVRPKYPKSGVSMGHEGTALVKVLVGLTGEVIDVKLLETSGYMELDREAIRVAWQVRFTPAEQDGKRVYVWVTIPYRFQLPPHQ